MPDPSPFQKLGRHLWADSPPAPLGELEGKTALQLLQPHGALRWSFARLAEALVADAALDPPALQPALAALRLGPSDAVQLPFQITDRVYLGPDLVAPLSSSVWAAGATALLPAPNLQPAQLALLLKRFDASVVIATTGDLAALLDLPLPPLAKLRQIWVAGEILPEPLACRWAEAQTAPLGLLPMAAQRR